LMIADRPLTLAEIKARVEMLRPVDTANPQATIRGAVNSVRLAAGLGGRPARYTWWPRHLADNTFRQPVPASGLSSGMLELGSEVWLPFWLDLDSRPFMRALHGRGLCLWRLGRVDEARHVFAWMLELNPNDNQGTRFLCTTSTMG
jgi:hypothetical protein